jgi:hypothetical protein
MPNDAKLGLMVGVGLVVVIGFVFFRKEPGPANPAEATPAAVSSTGTEIPTNLSQQTPVNSTQGAPQVPVSPPAPTAIPVSTTPAN